MLQYHMMGEHGQEKHSVGPTLRKETPDTPDTLGCCIGCSCCVPRFSYRFSFCFRQYLIHFLRRLYPHCIFYRNAKSSSWFSDIIFQIFFASFVPGWAHFCVVCTELGSARYKRRKYYLKYDLKPKTKRRTRGQLSLVGQLAETSIWDPDTSGFFYFFFKCQSIYFVWNVIWLLDNTAKRNIA